MDIIFQSGDFYGETASLWDFFSGVIAEILGALIGAGAAIGIFYCQIKREKQKEYANKEENRKNKVLYLGLLVKSSISIIRKEIEYLSIFIEDSNKDLTKIPLMNYVMDGDINRLLQVFNNEEYFHAFIGYPKNEEEKMQKIREYKNITSAIDWSNQTILAIKDMLQNNVNAHLNRYLLHKKLIDEILKQQKSIIDKPNSNIQLGQKMKEIIEKHLSGLADAKNYSDIKYFHDALITNSIEAMKKYGRDGDEHLDFWRNLLEVKELYENIIAQNLRHIQTAFSPWKAQFELALQNLEQNSVNLIKPFNEK